MVFAFDSLLVAVVVIVTLVFATLPVASVVSTKLPGALELEVVELSISVVVLAKLPAEVAGRIVLAVVLLVARELEVPVELTVSVLRVVLVKLVLMVLELEILLLVVLVLVLLLLVHHACMLTSLA